MDDLIQDFLSETSESLTELEKIILALESDPTQINFIRDAFRLLHTIKGTCGFLGFERMQRIAHKAENVLSKMRDGEITADTFITSSLFVTLDCIRSIVEGIQEAGAEPQNDDQNLLEALDKCLVCGNAQETTTQENAKTSETSREDSSLEDIPLDTPPISDDGTEAQKEAIAEQAPSPPSPDPSHNQPPPQEAGQKVPESHVPSGNQTIRIGLDVVDGLMNLVGELVLTRNQLLQQSEQQTSSEQGFQNNVLTRLSHLTTELQQTVMKTRMQPIETAWTKLPRIIRDISESLGKKIKLRQIGEDTELDRQVIEFIKDPLVHMVRNSADHGIEMPEERKAAGKSETGTVTLKAYHHGGHIFIEISDDGKGIDPDKIRAKAIEKGVVSQDEGQKLSPDQVLQLIFKPGFSTAEQVTNVSGRGVGMDVVKTNIEKLGGTVELHSKVGRGSTFVMKIPLTLSIVSSLLVQVSEQLFAIPQMAITEILNLRHQTNYKIEHIEGVDVLRWRNRLLPVIKLEDVLKIERNKPQQNSYIIILQLLNYSFGLAVDGIFDSQEIVVKPLSRMIEHIHLFSGSTILGNGQVVLILEPNSFNVQTEPVVEENKNTHKKDHLRPKETLILIFKSGEQICAVPLALVSRIDEVLPSEISNIQGKPILLYRDQLIPILGYESFSEDQDIALPILLFSDRGYKLALKIDEIVDILESSTDIQLSTDSEGSLGTSIIQGRPVSLIDSQHFFKKAYPEFHKRSASGEKKLLKLLLLDDSKFFLNLITPLLNVSGFAVKTASSVDDAINLCRLEEEPFHVIISDIEMPEKTGYDFITEIKGDERYESTPIIALSGKDSQEEIEKIKNAGFYEFVPKSDQQNLIRVLNHIQQEESQGAAHV